MCWVILNYPRFTVRQVEMRKKRGRAFLPYVHFFAHFLCPLAQSHKSASSSASVSSSPLPSALDEIYVIQYTCVCTGMVKKVGSRLRGLATAAISSQDAGSRNLCSTFFTIPGVSLDIYTLWRRTLLVGTYESALSRRPKQCLAKKFTKSKQETKLQE